MLLSLVRRSFLALLLSIAAIAAPEAKAVVYFLNNWLVDIGPEKDARTLPKTATNINFFAQDNEPYELKISCANSSVEVSLVSKGSWEAPNDGAANVIYRIDGATPVRTHWWMVATGKSVGTDDVHFLAAIQKGRRMEVLIFDQDRPHSGEFEIDGAGPALHALFELCTPVALM